MLELLAESTSAAVPAALRETTVAAALRVASGQTLAAVATTSLAARAEAACRIIAISRWKTFAGVLLLIGAFGTVLGLAIAAANSFQSRAPEEKAESSPVVQNDRTAKLRAILQLKGTWTSTETETSTLNDVPQPPKTVKILWSIDRDIITESDEHGFAWHTYRFTLDPDRIPNTIDLTLLNTGLELRGIYKLEGDVLTICEGLERPKDFEKSETNSPRTFHRESRTSVPLAPEIPNSPGCYWADAPRRGIPSSSASGGINYIVQKDPQGAMLVTLAFVAKLENGEPNVEYRPVAVDDNKTRFPFEISLSGGWSGSAQFSGSVLSHSQFRLDPEQLPFDRVQRLGIEAIPAEVTRAAALARSDRAYQEAREAGIGLLPRAEIGKPFDFSLTGSQGGPIHSSTLKGKVVLIDAWASWRSPCMGKMREVKELYDQRRRDGFEVIGVNFEDKVATDRLVKTLGLPWPQVVVPQDDRTRRLWIEGPGLRGTPRLLLIDREGILRWHGGPDELTKRITDLLDAPRR